jgi:hypothetical protein
MHAASSGCAHHPVVVQSREEGTVEGGPWLCTGLTKRRTLQRRCKRRHRPAGQAHRTGCGPSTTDAKETRGYAVGGASAR